MQPVLFLDFDDVLCLNNPYGGYDVAVPPWPGDLLMRLWHRPAMEVLQHVVDACTPLVVVTSSWLQIMTLPSVEGLLRQSGAGFLADALHPCGEALGVRGGTRLQAIDNWLRTNDLGQPYAILDDHLSGTGLLGSRHDTLGRLVLCDVDVGLRQEHVQRLTSALKSNSREG